jgi:hypothetical protein
MPAAPPPQLLASTQPMPLAAHPAQMQQPEPKHFTLPPMQKIPPTVQPKTTAQGGYQVSRDAKGNITGLTTNGWGDMNPATPAPTLGGAFFGR